MSGTATAPRLSLDLRRDSARVLVQDLRPRDVFGAQVLRGVVEGTLERLIVEGFAGSPEKQADRRPVVGTSWVFEKVEAARMSVVLMTRDNSPALPDVDADARARIDEAREGGAAVVAPARAVPAPGGSAVAWWEVDPRTGVTTAVSGEGLHQAKVQAIIVRVYGVIGVAITVGGKAIGSIQFGSLADARAFCTLMELRMLAEKINFNWFQLPF